MKYSVLIVVVVVLALAPSLQAQDTNFKMYSLQEEDQLSLYVDNKEPFPQSLQVVLSITGLKPSEKLSEFYIIPPNIEKHLIIKLLIPKNSAWSYKSTYKYYIGDVYAKHNDDFVYQLPFLKGEAFRLHQGYNGTLSHSGENALDFSMPEGTPITAARPGKVIRLKADSNRGCGLPSCKNLGNYITILHDDGTMADYYHLQQNGVLVEVGDDISVGDKIGLSGNTGWSTGPHLHFVVYKWGKKGRETIKTTFKVSDIQNGYLKEGKTYQNH